MGGIGPCFTLLLDTVSSAQAFVNAFFYVYILIILVYIVMSWVRLPYSLWLNRIQKFLYDVCDPYLRLFRKVLPPSARSTSRRWWACSCWSLSNTSSLPCWGGCTERKVGDGTCTC